MKDFADLDNSSGSFPDVVGVDASGPGETDGTELTADLFNDFMGAFQAILNDIGETPSGSSESGSGVSQILDAIKLLNYGGLIHIQKAQTNHNSGTQLAEWIYQYGSGGFWTAVENTGELIFPLELPSGLTLDLDIDVNVTPGAVRAGSNRMAVGIYYIEYGDGSHTQVGSTVYDDGTASNQTINITASSVVTSKDRCYLLRIRAGNTAAANNDLLYNVNNDITLS